MGAIETLARHPLAGAIGWGIVQSLWQIAVVAAVCGVALVLARRAAAGVRYAIAMVGLSLMLAWPALTVVTGNAEGAETRRAETRDAVVLPTPDAPAKAVSSDRMPVAGSRVKLRWQLHAVTPYAALFWAAGVLMLASRTLGGWILAQRLRRRAISAPPMAWQQRFSRLARRLNVGSGIALFESALVDVPTVLGWIKPVVLLPASAFAGLTPFQLEAILAHELAHVRRRDYLANLLQSTVEMLLFYHPAVWWLSRQARIEREHCCDDLAVSLCGDRVEYARALADLEATRRATPALALGANGGSLLRRVARLLDAPVAHDHRAPVWLVATGVLLLSGAVAAIALDPGRDVPALTSAHAGSAIAQAPASPAPPAPPTPPAAPAAGFDTDGEGRISRTSPTEKWSVSYKGALLLTDDERDVQRLSPGGYLKVTEGGWFSSRTVEITADASGRIGRRYWVGLREKPYEPDGRTLLADVLRKLVRSGFAAPSRVARLLKQGGPDAVLAAIGTLDSDFGRKTYFTELFRQATLDVATVARVLTSAGKAVTSDYEMAEMLVAAAPQAMQDPAARHAFGTAAATIESDYELRRALTAALTRADAAGAVDLLKPAGKLSSDFERAEFLLQWLRTGTLEPALADFLARTTEIGSAFDRERVLAAVVDRPGLTPRALAATLRSAESLNGQYELSQLLQRAARRHAIAGEVRDAYLAAADHLGDGYENDQVYAALVRSERRTKH